MDSPNSGMNEAMDWTSTGGGVTGGPTGAPGGTYSGARIVPSGDSGTGVPGVPVGAGMSGIPVLAVAGGRGWDKISPVRRSLQTISTARVVSASRISFCWLRLMTFLLRLIIVPLNCESAHEGLETTL